MLQFDTKGGADAAQIRDFAQHLKNKQAIKTGFDVKIIIDNDLELIAYDNAQLMCSLIDALQAYYDDIA